MRSSCTSSCRPHLPPLAALPALTSLTLSGVPNASDETLRLVGQRHAALAALSLTACSALNGSGLSQAGSFPALRRLSVDHCDALTGCGAGLMVLMCCAGMMCQRGGEHQGGACHQAGKRVLVVF